MNRFTKFGIALILVFALGLGSASCGNTDSKPDYELWGAHSLVKVQQDLPKESYAADRTAAVLDYEMAKNEYENAQIILSANSNVREFNAAAGDLTGPNGAKIPKSEITVYKQRYIYVKVNMTAARPFKPGWYPDALVPMEKAHEKGENSVKAGENQGVYVTVRTDKDTPAGEYAGILTLTADGAVNAIPMKVTVWDFAIPDEVHTQSCFNYFRDMTISGELDNTEEMAGSYLETLSEFRLSISDLPYFDSTDVDGWVETAKKYAANPKYSGFRLPYEIITREVELIDPADPAVLKKVIGDIDYDLLERQLIALANASTPELPLLKKAFLYFSSALDEAWMHSGWDSVRYINTMVNRLLIKVADGLEAQNPDFFEEHGLTREDMVKMQNLNTDPYFDVIAGYVPTYVPQVQNFNTQEGRDVYLAEERNSPLSSGTTWWYHCIDPVSPYPTYHIDDYLVSARTLSWMQYEYGIDGMLYWGTNTYPNAMGAYTKPTNIWDDATKLTLRAAANGDGFLLYPGLDYGIDAPLPSIRLQAIRDGLEDYEYLWLFEQAIKDVNRKYATSFDSNRLLEKLFRNLYSGVVTTVDTKVVQETRAQLAALLNLITSDASVVVNIQNVDSDAETAVVEVLYDNAFTLSVDGKAQERTPQGTGSKSTVTVKLGEDKNYFEGTLTNGAVTIRLKNFVANRLTSLNRFESAEDLSKIKVSRGNKPEAFDHIAASGETLNGRTAAKIIISPSDMGSVPLNTIYKPSVWFNESETFPGIKLTEVDTVSVRVYNASASPQSVRLKLYSGNLFDQTIATVLIQPGEWAVVSKDQVFNVVWSKLDNVTRIGIETDNDTQSERIFYIDSLYFSFKA